MSDTQTTETTPRRNRLLLGVAAAAVALLGAGLTYALWGDQATQPGGIITAGNLDIELVGQTAWTDDSCGPGETIDPATRLAVPGDTFTVTQQFQTLLEGDNIAGRVTVGWDPAPGLPTGVTGSYVLSGGALAAPTAPTPLGTSLTVPASPANAPEGDDTWTVTVTLEYAETMPDRVVLPAALAAEPTQFADLGTITLTLNQVRDGDGFTP